MRRSGLEIQEAAAQRNRELEARLRVWGLVYRGGWPVCSLSRNGIDERPTLDEHDAAKIEEAMCCVRARRWRLFRLARLEYVAGKPEIVLCTVFRCSGRTLRRMRRQLYRAVDAALGS
jgi:hypothetical protein